MDLVMRQIWPVSSSGPLDDAAIERLYTYPDRPWLAVNFISSADGAVELNGTASELSNEPDQRILRLGSDLADLLLVGATTAVVEGFRGMQPDELTARRRREHGLAPVAPTAVVTTGSLPGDASVITDAQVPTIVITCASAPAQARNGWAEAGAKVLECGEKGVDLARAVTQLREWGLRRIDCEGGPHLFGSLQTWGLVDELRLTLSPTLVAGPAERIATSADTAPTRLSLASVLAQDDTLLMRYLRA
jgi:riboflavin biosynthesis pyrimidine reductase